MNNRNKRTVQLACGKFVYLDGDFKSDIIEVLASVGEELIQKGVSIKEVKDALHKEIRSLIIQLDYADLRYFVHLAIAWLALFSIEIGHNNGNSPAECNHHQHGLPFQINLN